MIDAALYATVWLATALFVAGEAGKARESRSGSTGWPWMVWTAGAVLLAVHMAIALDVRHGWSHASVVRTVEDQARAVYGVGWGGGAWMNYAFLALWLIECAWWRIAPGPYRARLWAITAATRAFYALMLVNSAIVFAAPSRRPAGLVLIAILLWAWRDTFAPIRRIGRVPAAVVIVCLAAGAIGAGSTTEARQAPQLDLEPARAAASALPRLHSLLVSWRGALVFEYYGKGIRPARATNVKSVSKSVISTLVGIALERRLIPSLDTPISTYFPELLKDPDPRKRKITVEHLVSMQAGLESTSFDNYGSWVRSRNWVQFALARPIIAEPGTVMEYSTGNTHLLSAILTKATKMSTHRFAQEALATPLGMTLAPWPRDPQGIFFGGNDMLLTPAHMVKLGRLYLARGRFDGRQIVPARWVETSCVSRGRSRFNPDQGYGYGWWTRDFGGRESCFAWGFGGQYIFTFPDLDLVVVTTSAADVSDERRDHRRMIFDLVERHVLQAVGRQK